MKKLLLEYANTFAYTITGLVFGCAFFLLFINFYHMQELSETVDVSTYNESNKVSIEGKIQTIKDNIGVYSQSTYRGNLSIYGLNNVQARLQNCVTIIESEDMMKYLELDEIGIKDSYNFVVDYKKNILNDCLVMQIVSMLNANTVEDLPNYNLVSPVIQVDIDNLLGSVDYIQNNIENSDHYYFTTDSNKDNFFDLVKDSYTTTMKEYQNSLDLLVEISNWYRNVVLGG